MRALSAALMTLLSAHAFAGEKMAGAAIEAILNDTTAWYLPLSAASARQYFHYNGETPYVDSKGNKTYGEWMVRGDQYCSIWPPSDHYVCYNVEKASLANGTPTIIFVSGGGGTRYEAVMKRGKHTDEAWRE